MEREKMRNVLLHALEEQLFTELRRLGFTGPDTERIPIDEHPQDALLFHFRQSTPAMGDVVLAVNVKSFRRPTFNIFAGRVPAQGVKLVDPEETIPPARVTADMLEEQAFLQAERRPGYAPFRQPLWAFLIGSPSGIRQAVQRAAVLLPELVEWLKTRAPSPHVWNNRPPRAAATRLPEAP